MGVPEKVESDRNPAEHRLWTGEGILGGRPGQATRHERKAQDMVSGRPVCGEEDSAQVATQSDKAGP